jgi:SAM-dependent methyltransferase
MAYYDRIAEHWHEITGYNGDAFKALVLNDLLLERLAGVDKLDILELGAGNGYFLPLVLKHFPGQTPASLTITDQSERQLQIAQQYFPIAGATYQQVDVEFPLPFEAAQFDLIIASMIFNEIPAKAYKLALQESQRVLRPGGHLLMTVTHPAFIERLNKSQMLKPEAEEGGVLTMPGTGSLRLPLALRSVVHYRRGLQDAGFVYDEEECHATPEVLNLKAGLRNSWKIPIALIYNCTKKS